MTIALVSRQFVAGFGSNGGEEFLSYMQISETLLAKGGKEWQDFDKSMTENLGRIQNPDGSWSGHHCITGRTFCTSAATMSLDIFITSWNWRTMPPRAGRHWIRRPASTRRPTGRKRSRRYCRGGGGCRFGNACR